MSKRRHRPLFNIGALGIAALSLGYLVNGKERVRLDEASVTGAHYYRFFAQAAAGSIDVSGRWAVRFLDDDGKPEIGVGEFTQSRDVVGGTLAGDFWVGMAHHERWTAKRDANAVLPDAYALTNLRSGDKRFYFAFPDLAGKTVTSKDQAFHGKVLIVAMDCVYAFPTTIFIDRKGVVRKIHTVFSGPATREHYIQFVDEVKATLDPLLAEA